MPVSQTMSRLSAHRHTQSDSQLTFETVQGVCVCVCRQVWETVRDRQMRGHNSANATKSTRLQQCTNSCCIRLAQVLLFSLLPLCSHHSFSHSLSWLCRQLSAPTDLTIISAASSSFSAKCQGQVGTVGKTLLIFRVILFHFCFLFFLFCWRASCVWFMQRGETQIVFEF